MALFDRPYITSYLWSVVILHRFRDITTITAYMTVSDLEKSFSIDITLSIICFPIRV